MNHSVLDIAMSSEFLILNSFLRTEVRRSVPQTTLNANDITTKNRTCSQENQQNVITTDAGHYRRHLQQRSDDSISAISYWTIAVSLHG